MADCDGGALIGGSSRRCRCRSADWLLVVSFSGFVFRISVDVSLQSIDALRPAHQRDTSSESRQPQRTSTTD